MRAFLDTSVLVAVFYRDHAHHRASLDLLVQFDKTTGCCAGHSLAEVYSTLTRMPGRHRVGGEQALLFVGNLCERLSVVALDGGEYAGVLENAAALGIAGGAIYDYLLASCALKAGVESIYSWNLRHYSLFGTDVVSRLATP